MMRGLSYETFVKTKKGHHLKETAIFTGFETETKKKVFLVSSAAAYVVFRFYLSGPHAALFARGPPKRGVPDF